MSLFNCAISFNLLYYRDSDNQYCRMMQMNLTLKHKHNYLLQTTTKTTTNNKQLLSVIVPSEKLVDFSNQTGSYRDIICLTVYVRQNTQQ